MIQSLPSHTYSWADFPRKRARELNPTSAVGTLACSPFVCGAGAVAMEGRALRKEKNPHTGYEEQDKRI